MVKVSVYFLATVVWLLLSTGSIEASQVAVPVAPFKASTIPALVERIHANARQFSLLSNDFSAASTVNFAVSHDLLASIIPYDAEKKLFVLPETPTVSTISKLIFALTANSKRLGVLSLSVRQYSHYDQLSLRMFENVSMILSNNFFLSYSNYIFSLLNLLIRSRNCINRFLLLVVTITMKFWML